MRAIIYRGCSGAGKTREAVAWRNDYLAKIISADSFFSRSPYGKYHFKPELLPDAHQWCLRAWIESCKEQLDIIVCDNTNILIAELAPYVAVAQAYGYQTEIITIAVDPVKAHARNLHQTPIHEITSQAKLLALETERFPPWWKHAVIDEPLPKAPE